MAHSNMLDSVTARYFSCGAGINEEKRDQGKYFHEILESTNM
jgi:hypothetical protein